MKACVIQPPYSMDQSEADVCFRRRMELLDNCGEDLDLIVMPEGSDEPCAAFSAEERARNKLRYNKLILDKASETAKRCGAVVFINAISEEENGERNTTYAFDTNGRLAGKYFKQHPTPSEMGFKERDNSYTYESETPTILEIDGIRYAFLTCYDFYFYENFSNIARQRPDIIIGCSMQRSDTHQALMLINRFCAYNTNAYIVRSSVSMGEDSPLGGCSCIIKPDGTVLADMESRIGMAAAEFDPHDKYYKPAGFGNPPAAHWEYIEQGRRPWKYRPGGSAVVRPDRDMPYPRVCAHRGFNTAAPENSLPAYGAAVALGAEEIEFDLWPTVDGEIVSTHDSRLERVSDGTGFVYEHTYAQLLQYDFGVKFGEKYRGLKVLRFEEILQKLACHVVMNIHIKEMDPYDPEILKKIISLIRKYDCEKYVYFLTSDAIHSQLAELAPDIPRCCGANGHPENMVDRAVANGYTRVQFVSWEPLTKEMVDRAHEHGLICNICQADTPEKAEKYLEMGIDTIMTNDYQRVADFVHRWKR